MDNEGTFKCCSLCNKCINCCQMFDKLNAPVLCEKEKNEISKYYKDFYVKISDNLYNLKTTDNHCIFYQDNKCIIYDDRPFDCKLYPFDIIKKDNKYYLILYKLDCLKADYLDNIGSLNSLINKIKPWLEVFTDKKNYTKMINKDYVIIKEII